MAGTGSITMILADEYGIFTQEQLDAAIARLGKVDISIFCKPLQNKEESKHDTDGTEKTEGTTENDRRIKRGTAGRHVGGDFRV